MAAFCYSLWSNSVLCGGRFLVGFMVLCEEYDH